MEQYTRNLLTFVTVTFIALLGFGVLIFLYEYAELFCIGGLMTFAAGFIGFAAVHWND